jgi:hypothetical protein
VELNYLEGREKWNVRLMITPSKILESGHLIDLNMLKRKIHYSKAEKSKTTVDEFMSKLLVKIHFLMVSATLILFKISSIRINLNG